MDSNPLRHVALEIASRTHHGASAEGIVDAATHYYHFMCGRQVFEFDVLVKAAKKKAAKKRSVK